jgi:hypothetical protein
VSTTTRKSVYPDATTVIAIAGEMAVSVRTLLDNFAAFARSHVSMRECKTIGLWSRLLH